MKFIFEHVSTLARQVALGGLLVLASGLTPSLALAHEVDGASPHLAVQVWDESTWGQMQRTGPRPAAYLFTTTYCSTCVEAYETLRNRVEKMQSATGTGPWLSVVMMDVSGVKAQHHASHFQGLNALYAFEGYEPAVRASVDPQWPEVTPYIVLVDRQGKVQKILGQPSQPSLNRWLK
jgi:hypothetical protein